jgi:prepilin-type processing-associated H-X9-DG protein
MLFSERRNPENRNWGSTPTAASPQMGFIHTTGSSRVINVHANAPSSAHPNGVVMAFCDGHTIFLSDARLSGDLYSQLLTTNTLEASVSGLPLLNESVLKNR